MTDPVWQEGLRQLALAFPDRAHTKEFMARRGDLYRTHLDDLTDDAWLHAVAEAIRYEEWFPTVALLRKYSEAFYPPGHLLPPVRRTPEEIAAGKAEARNGLELIRAECRKRGIDVPDPVRPMPDGGEAA